MVKGMLITGSQTQLLGGVTQACVVHVCLDFSLRQRQVQACQPKEKVDHQRGESSAGNE